MQESAFDPKRTSAIPEPSPSRAPVRIATITCLSLGGGNETAPIHQIDCRVCGVLAVRGTRTAAGSHAAYRRAHELNCGRCGGAGTPRGVCARFARFGPS